MQIGILADLHLNLYRRFNPFFVHVENAVDEFVKECKKRKVNLIVVNGDMFHTKYQLSTEALIKANNILNKMRRASSQIVLIRGNHDSASSMEQELNLINNYANIPGIRVVNDYELQDLGGVRMHYVAYYEDKELKQKIYNCRLATRRDEVKTNILFGHFAVSGFKMQGDYEDRGGLKQTNLLRDFRQVFLGHFHGHQHQDNIWYVSAPLQSRHGDEEAQHGFMFYNTETDEAEFVENKTSPRFITLDFTKDNIKQAFLLENHYIRFIVNKHISRDLFTSVRNRLLMNNYDVEFRFNIKDDILNFTSMDGFIDLKHYSTDELFTIYLQEITNKPTDTTTENLLQAILN